MSVPGRSVHFEFQAIECKQVNAVTAPASDWRFACPGKNITLQTRRSRAIKGAIQFSPGRPIPAALVRDIVMAKVAEIELRWPVIPKKSTVRKTSPKK